MTNSIFDKWHRLPEAPRQVGTWDAGTLFGTQLQRKDLGTDVPASYNIGKNIINQNEYMGRFASSGTGADTLTHEQEHVLQDRGAQRYGESFGSIIDNMFDSVVLKHKGIEEKIKPGTIGAYGAGRGKMHRNLGKDTVVKRLQELGADDAYLTNYTFKDVRAGSGKDVYNHSPLYEVFASLSGLEEANRIDITKDKILRKELFDDNPALIEAYKAVTGLRQERLDAKDLTPYAYTPPPPEKKRTVRERIVDLFADPFKDTTR